MGFWSGLAKFGANLIPGVGPAISGLIDAGGAALSAGSQASADNRGATIAALLDADKLRLAGEQDRRVAESDIMRKLAQTAYLRGGGASTEPRSIMMGGQSRTLPTFGFGPRAASAEQMQGASELEKLLLARMANPFTLSDVSKHTKAGMGEKLSGLFGAGLTAYGAMKKPKPPVMS